MILFCIALCKVVKLPTIGIAIGVALAVVGRAITNEREIKDWSKEREIKHWSKEREITLQEAIEKLIIG